MKRPARCDESGARGQDGGRVESSLDFERPVRQVGRFTNVELQARYA